MGQNSDEICSSSQSGSWSIITPRSGAPGQKLWDFLCNEDIGSRIKVKSRNQDSASSVQLRATGETNIETNNKGTTLQKTLSCGGAYPIHVPLSSRKYIFCKAIFFNFHLAAMLQWHNSLQRITTSMTKTILHKEMDFSKVALPRPCTVMHFSDF